MRTEMYVQQSDLLMFIFSYLLSFFLFISFSFLLIFISEEGYFRLLLLLHLIPYFSLSSLFFFLLFLYVFLNFPYFSSLLCFAFTSVICSHLFLYLITNTPAA